MFPEYYTEYFKKYSSAVARCAGSSARARSRYVGHELLQIDIDNLKAAVEGLDVTDVFMPSSGPSGFGKNEYYDSHEEYLDAVAEAMREEYLGIVDAGFILQVDDPWLIDTLSDPAAHGRRSATGPPTTTSRPSTTRCATSRPIKSATTRATASTTVRVSPTSPLAKVVPFMLRINAGAYSFEVANPRHMHEYRVWEDVKLPDDKVLIPGLIGHANNYVEHAELIAEYIVRYADIVGKERVIAGADCGFSSRASYTPEVHPTVVWPKFTHLAQGAELATKQLWK